MLGARSNSLGLRTLGDDEAVGRLGQLRHQGAHQLDVGGAEAAEGEVDEGLLAARELGGRLPVGVGPTDRGAEVVPGRSERLAARVVDLLRIEVEVEGRAGVDEVVAGERRGAALTAEFVELGVHLLVGGAVGVPEVGPAGAVLGRQAGEDRRQVGVLDLQRVAGVDPGPRAAGGEERREGDDVVTGDEVGLQLAEDLRQSLVDVLGPVDQRLEGGRDELAELRGRRPAEDRRRVADEVLPELARRFLALRRRGQAHRPLLEALRLERPGE
jgi:hypothetical protein